LPPNNLTSGRPALSFIPAVERIEPRVAWVITASQNPVPRRISGRREGPGGDEATRGPK